MADNYRYATLYAINLRLVIGADVIAISPGDIVSVVISNQYDTKTYPMFRLRLYSDLSILQTLTDNPDNIYLRGTMDGAVYKMGSDNESPIPISPTKSIQISLKAYIEFKNTPTSKMDQYTNGLPVTTEKDLNANNKVPIELYCYDDQLIHRMKDRAQAIYHDMTITSILNAMLSHCNIQKMLIDPIQNQERYKQILIPNLSMIDAVSFFDVIYGLYPKGGMMFGALDRLYISNLDSNNGMKPLPIYVQSYRNDNDMNGMVYTSQGYFMQTGFANVSIMSESDVEQVLQSERITAVNLSTLHITEQDLPFYQESETQSNPDLITQVASNNISPRIMLHKSSNPYYASTVAARINERITRIDISGTGFDIAQMTPNARYNLIFESPLRGVDMNSQYRASFMTHSLTCVGSNLFSPQTTMTLCRN